MKYLKGGYLRTEGAVAVKLCVEERRVSRKGGGGGGPVVHIVLPLPLCSCLAVIITQIIIEC